MVLHPDAKAFVARILSNPPDRLARLVFADWLEERGDKWHELWARYLRFMAHADEDIDGVSFQRAESIGWALRARLMFPNVPREPHLPWLTALLPAHRIWLRLGPTRLPRETVELCPESIARQFQVMLFAVVNRSAFFVFGDSAGYESVRETLRLILNRKVVLFRGEPDDVRQAIQNHYSAEIESVGGYLSRPIREGR